MLTSWDVLVAAGVLNVTRSEQPSHNTAVVYLGGFIAFSVHTGQQAGPTPSSFLLFLNPGSEDYHKRTVLRMFYTKIKGFRAQLASWHTCGSSQEAQGALVRGTARTAPC